MLFFSIINNSNAVFSIVNNTVVKLFFQSLTIVALFFQSLTIVMLFFSQSLTVMRVFYPFNLFFIDIIISRDESIYSTANTLLPTEKHIFPSMTAFQKVALFALYKNFSFDVLSLTERERGNANM